MLYKSQNENNKLADVFIFTVETFTKPPTKQLCK